MSAEIHAKWLVRQEATPCIAMAGQARTAPNPPCMRRLRCSRPLNSHASHQTPSCRQFGDEGIAALASLSALSRLDLMYRCGRLAGRSAAGSWWGGSAACSCRHALSLPPVAGVHSAAWRGAGVAGRSCHTAHSAAPLGATHCSWKITDDALRTLGRMTSLLRCAGAGSATGT